MVEFLPDGWLLVGREGTADLGQHPGWGDGVGAATAALPSCPDDPMV